MSGGSALASNGLASWSAGAATTARLILAGKAGTPAVCTAAGSGGKGSHVDGGFAASVASAGEVPSHAAVVSFSRPLQELPPQLRAMPDNPCNAQLSGQRAPALGYEVCSVQQRGAPQAHLLPPRDRSGCCGLQTWKPMLCMSRRNRASLPRLARSWAAPEL
jgi:hypothetical protein